MIATTIVGKSIVTGLTSESNNRIDSNQILQYPVGIASTSTNYYQIVAKALDQEILDTIQNRVDLINQKKSEIVGLCAQSFGVYVPGFNPPLCTLAQTVAEITTDIDSETGVYPSVTGGTGSGGTTTQAIAYGVVRPDYIRIQRYPDLENRTAPDDNPLSGLTFPVLDSGTAGQGKQNIFFENSKWDDEYVTYYVTNLNGDYSTTGWSGGDTLGNYYKVTGPGIGFILVYGSVNEDAITFTINPAYEPYLSQFVGIQTGIWDPEGPNDPVLVAWNPVTTQIYSVDFIPPKNPNQPPTLRPIYEGPGILSIKIWDDPCVGIATQVSALEDEIDQLRVGITTYFVETNTIKKRKHSQQLRIWSYERIKSRNTTEQVAITTAITATEKVDPTLPSYPDYTIDTVKYTIDSDTITIDIN